MVRQVNNIVLFSKSDLSDFRKTGAFQDFSIYVIHFCPLCGQNTMKVLGRSYCCKVTSVVSDSVRPHRRQPTRLPHPWDSPGKNAGVGCHVLLQCMKVKSESEVAQSCATLRDPVDCSPPGFSVHGILQARRVLEWGAIAFSTREERHCLFGATGVRFRELLKKTRFEGWGTSRGCRGQEVGSGGCDQD